MVVPSLSRPNSPRRVKSPGDTKTPIKTPIDGHYVEVYAIVTVPSPLRHTSPHMAKSFEDVKALLHDNDMLVLQNHFSSLDGLETIDVGGDPHIGVSIILTTIVEFNYDHITVENQVVSKIWAHPKEMEEHASDNGEEIVRTKRKQGRPPKGTN